MRELRSPEDLALIRESFAAAGPAHRSVAFLRVASIRDLQKPQGRLQVVVPGSKSFTSRALVLGGMAARAVELEGVLLSDDSYWGLEVLLRLGFGVDLDPEAHRVVIVPRDQVRGRRSRSEGASPGRLTLPLGMAGTLARFVPALVLNSAWLGSQACELVGEPRLCERPLLPLVSALRDLGARIQGERLPLILEASPLAGTCSISGAVSGQFLSGLILAGAGAREGVTIHRTQDLVQPDYVRMTIAAARAFGAAIDADTDLTCVRTTPVEELYPDAGRYVIEADASTACYFFAMAALLDLDLEVTNLGQDSLQPDLRFLNFLERMGARFERRPGSVRHLPRGNTALTGGFEMDFSEMSDQALTAGALGVFADAPVRISGVGHIRLHESDRIGCLVQNLKAVGVQATEDAGGFEVFPLPAGGEPRLRGLWKTHKDHRFAMVGALLAMKAPELCVADPWVCEKTAPRFFVDLERLGVAFEISHTLAAVTHLSTEVNPRHTKG